MPNIGATIQFKNGEIVLGLPITTPTGKIRVKRKEDKFDFGAPVASKQTVLDENCYIEWQIGYDNPDENAEGVVQKIQFIRKGEPKFGYELTSIFWMGLMEKVFDKNRVDELLSFANSIQPDDLIEENSQITRNNINDKIIKNINFHIIEEKYPVYLLAKDDYEIDVVLRHKQRAVGYQSMIYLWLPIKNAENDLTGRTAGTKEFAYFKISEDKNSFVFDTIKIFSLASKQHNEDMKNILLAIKQKL